MYLFLDSISLSARGRRSTSPGPGPCLREYIWKNELEDPDAATSAWGAPVKASPVLTTYHTGRRTS